MVRVDADGVRLEVEGVLAVLDLLQLVLVQVGPPPDAGVDHVREPFPARNLDKEKLQVEFAQAGIFKFLREIPLAFRFPFPFSK